MKYFYRQTWFAQILYTNWATDTPNVHDKIKLTERYSHIMCAFLSYIEFISVVQGLIDLSVQFLAWVMPWDHSVHLSCLQSYDRMWPTSILAYAQMCRDLIFQGCCCDCLLQQSFEHCFKFWTAEQAIIVAVANALDGHVWIQLLNR